MSEINLSKFHEIERQETEFIKVLESFKLPVFLLKKESETLPDSVCIVCADVLLVLDCCRWRVIN